MARILIVEDDANIANILKLHLAREGFDCHNVADGSLVVDCYRDWRPDLIVLDLMLPGIDGLELCRLIRSESHVSILMLTARRDEMDKVIGLELGADDYMVKPFSIREFVSKVKAMLRRASWDKCLSSGMEGVIVHGAIEIDTINRQVRTGQEEVALTPAEFDILAALAKRPGTTFSRTQLQSLARGLYPADTYDRSVDSIVARLRKKLGDDVANPQYIGTVRGLGYRWIWQETTNPTHP